MYTLTSGITNNLMIKTMRQALDAEELLTDFLPGEIRTRRKLCEYNYAVKQIPLSGYDGTFDRGEKAVGF